MMTDHHEVRSEIECKLLCLNRLSQFSVQQFIKWLSIHSDIALSARVASPGKALSAVLQHHRDIVWNIKSLKYSVNKSNFFAADKIFRSNIDVDKIDATPACQILRKLPAYPTCAKRYHPIHLEDIVHSDKAVCTHDLVCCSLCLKCAQCCGTCGLSSINVKELSELRNIDAHYTKKELKDISDSMENQPTGPLTLEWNKRLNEWTDIIVEIFKVLRGKKFLDDSTYKHERQKLRNVLLENKDVYLRCCFPGENILSLLYRNVYCNHIEIKLKVLTRDWEKLAAAEHLRNELSISLRRTFSSEAKNVLTDHFRLNGHQSFVDIKVNGFSFENSRDNRHVVASICIKSKENDIIPKEYEDTLSQEALNIMGAFECALTEALTRSTRISDLNVQCFGYKFSSINIDVLVSGANTNFEKDAVKEELTALVSKGYFNGILNDFRLHGCILTLVLPSEDEQKILSVAFKTYSYTENTHHLMSDQKALIKQKIEERCRAIINSFDPQFKEALLHANPEEDINEERLLEEERLYVYLVDKKFSTNVHKPIKFAEVFLKKYSESREGLPLHLHKFRHPVLETLSYALSNIMAYEELMIAVDETLDAFNMANKKVTKEEVNQVIEEDKKVLNMLKQYLRFTDNKTPDDCAVRFIKDHEEISRTLGHLMQIDCGIEQLVESSNETNRPSEQPKDLLFTALRCLCIMKEFKLIEELAYEVHSHVYENEDRGLNRGLRSFCDNYRESWYQWKLGLSEGSITELCLLRKTDVNAKDDKGLTALMHASRCGHFWFVKKLLEQNSDVNAADNEGLTALMHAARSDRQWCLKELLENKSEVDAKDNEGYTALMHAIRRKNLSCVEKLLENKCDVNAKDNEGLTALMHAARSTDSQWCVKQLLENKSDVNAIDDKELTALTHAERSNSGSEMRELLKTQLT